MRTVVTILRIAIVGYMVIFVMTLAFRFLAGPPQRIFAEPEETPFIRASVWPIVLIDTMKPKVKAWSAAGLAAAAVATVSFVAGYGAGVRDSRFRAS